MKLTRSFVAAALTIFLSIFSFLSLAATPVAGQDTRVALQRGYRTGYSDGYMAGYRDSIDNLIREMSRHKEFSDANRAFSKDYGSIEDYSDGYRQGFSSGYSTGFEKRSFDSAVPSSLDRKGLAEVSQPPAPEMNSVAAIVEVPKLPETQVEIEAPKDAIFAPTESLPIPANIGMPAVEPIAVIKKASYIVTDDPIIIIPRDTELIIELQEELGTDSNRDGDRFTAKIVSPSEIAGATIEGRIDRIQKPGRIKRRSQLELSFDRIILTEDRWSNFGAILTEVVAVKGDNVRNVDNEGTAIGQSTLKGDSVKIGASTGAGLGIGALAGGPVGAAVGAGVGAAFGVGAVFVERGKHIQLNRNQQLKIKAAYETKIR